MRTRIPEKGFSHAGDETETVTGKIQKFKMRETAVETLGLEETDKIKTA